MLTGRKARKRTLRQCVGISGFHVRSESPFDAFGTAHSTTSCNCDASSSLSAAAVMPAFSL
ncbi:hypothetical protein HF650_12605 [Kosakonia sp. SMBL-WEM22]|nr:hypothetical protein HF650_12605 [Kosakonia sp. SMBL-WEM22]